MLITPALAFLPNNVPCGPRSTSIRSTSTRSPNASPARANTTPSTTVEIDGSPAIEKVDVPTPRRNSDWLSVVPDFWKVERRDQVHRPLQTGTSGRRQRLPADHGHRQRHVLQPLAPLLRGDQDVAFVRRRREFLRGDARRGRGGGIAGGQGAGCRPHVLRAAGAAIRSADVATPRSIAIRVAVAFIALPLPDDRLVWTVSSSAGPTPRSTPGRIDRDRRVAISGFPLRRFDGIRQRCLI